MTGYQTDTSGAQYWHPKPRETVREAMIDQLQMHIRNGHHASDFYRQVLRKIQDQDEGENPAAALLQADQRG